MGERRRRGSRGGEWRRRQCGGVRHGGWRVGGGVGRRAGGIGERDEGSEGMIEGVATSKAPGSGSIRMVKLVDGAFFVRGCALCLERYDSRALTSGGGHDMRVPASLDT